MIKDLKYWFVFIEEYSGYDCDGHFVPKFAVAETEEEVIKIMSSYITEGTRYTAPAALPSKLNFKKPRYFDLWSVAGEMKEEDD